MSDELTSLRNQVVYLKTETNHWMQAAKAEMERRIQAEQSLLIAQPGLAPEDRVTPGEADTKPLVSPADLEMIDGLFRRPYGETSWTQSVAAWSRIRQALHPQADRSPIPDQGVA